MDIKRILTSLIGLPLVVLLIVLGTPQVINFGIMIVAIICMYEYFNVTKKICKPIQWLGYLSTSIIFLTSIFPIEAVKNIIIFGLPVIILILFLHIIITDMKISFKDVAYTLLGIIYITGFILFLGLIVAGEKGKFIIGYCIVVAWSTDIFAYFTGKKFGKHHFSKVSPKKSIEGCIAGALSAIIFGVIYIVILNKFKVFNFSGIAYVYAAITSLILSIVSQIGDFAASSIKRFADAKDYGTILPGHGGMLDRIDSLIFIAPFVYFITMFIV